MGIKLSFKQKFQLGYIFLHIICLIGIAGNIELGVKTPVPAIILTVVTGILTIGKIIYIARRK